MKEDVLEQILDDYLMHRGYFTRHNIKFKPNQERADYVAKEDAVASDIDVLAIHPARKGKDRVIVASCKAWQGGFNPGWHLRKIRENGVVGGRPAWKGFRELVQPKWSEAFRQSIRDATGSKEFTYWIVVTALKGKDGRES